MVRTVLRMEFCIPEPQKVSKERKRLRHWGGQKAIVPRQGIEQSKICRADAGPLSLFVCGRLEWCSMKVVWRVVRCSSYITYHCCAIESDLRQKYPTKHCFKFQTKQKALEINYSEILFPFCSKLKGLEVNILLCNIYFFALNQKCLAW